MKKFIILLTALPLVLTSCFKEDDDVFDKSAAERIYQTQLGTEKVLNEAPNGWLMEYYPSKTQESGGVRIFMKFDNGKVSISSEHGAADQVETSYYSYDQDYGPTINFDTYNSLFHYYTEPNSGVGSTYIGFGGDSEFTIVSYASDEVVLEGIKTKNRIVMTPLPADKDWKTLLQEYFDFRDKLEEEMPSYTMSFNAQTYEVIRSETAQYASRYWRILSPAGEEIDASFIYTDYGIKFYEPVELLSGIEISELIWENGKLTDAATGVTVSPITSNNKLELSVSGVTDWSAKVGVTVSNNRDYYLMGIVAVSKLDGMSDVAFQKSLLAGRTDETLQLSSGSTSTPSTIDRLMPATKHVAYAFGVGVSSEGTLYPTTKLVTSEFETGEELTASPEYNKWLGTWKVTSTSSELSKKPLSFDITISKYIAERAYAVSGWGVSVAGSLYDLIVMYEGRGLAFYDGTVESTAEGNVVSSARFYYTDEEEYYLIGIGDGVPALSAKFADSEDEADLVGYEFSLQDSPGPYTVSSLEFFMEVGSSLYLFNPASGFEAQDFPVGPYKMQRKSSSAKVSKKQLDLEKCYSPVRLSTPVVSSFLSDK